MSISKKQARSVRQPVLVGDIQSTIVLDGTNTTDTITLSCIADKVSFQGSDTLAGTVTFSLDGINFGNSTNIGASNAIVTFSTHLVKVIKVTRSSGTGKLTIVGK